MAQRDEPAGLLDEEVNRHCGRISPTAFRSNDRMQEMEKLNGTDAFTIYNKYWRPNDAVAGT
ncbi:hypothetical protein NKH57_30370 [Mesorhizobium sp. M1050]|uniref:hypothetical protein n=1 Tax=Mesorhizobium sp. M1050 TaxID=2957051 RepID=UPI00333D446A